MKAGEHTSRKFPISSRVIASGNVSNSPNVATFAMSITHVLKCQGCIICLTSLLLERWYSLPRGRQIPVLRRGPGEREAGLSLGKLPYSSQAFFHKGLKGRYMLVAI